MRTNLHRLVQRSVMALGVTIAKSAGPGDFAEEFGRLRPRELAATFVRIGPDGDGGYVLPEILEGVGGLISPGVGQQSGFEDEIVARGIPALLIDASVSGPALQNPEFRFLPKYLGARTLGDFISLDEAVAFSEFSGDLILQMDIEGHEFSTLIAASPLTLKRFRIIVLELHRLTELVTVVGLATVRALIDSLLESHVVVHQHENTKSGAINVAGSRIADVIELTLVREDYFVEGTPNPHPTSLDFPNREET